VESKARRGERESGTYLDVEEVFSENWGSMVDGDTRTIELATKHLGGDGHAEHVAGELNVGVHVVDVGSAFENLDDSTLASDFENLALAHLAVSESHVDDFCVSGREIRGRGG
jgi:hypothetical protein